MKQKVTIKSLVDRPSLALKQNETLTLTLENDSLVFLHQEEINGLIEILEVLDFEDKE